MPSSLSTLGLVALLFLLFSTEMASTSPVSQQDDHFVFIHQRPLQQLDPQISARIPDSSIAEDSYLVALRESQRNRNKVTSSATNHHQHHHHHEEKHHHHTESHRDSPPSFVEDANEQFNGQHHLIQVPTTYEHVLNSRPLTAMEKNYLRPHRPQPTEQYAVQNTQLEEIHQLEEASEEEELSEEVMETSASKEVIVNSAPLPFSSDSDANSIFSAYSSNTARVVNNKQVIPSIKKTVSDVNSMYSAYSNTARNVNNNSTNTAVRVVSKKPSPIKKTVSDINSMYSAYSSNTAPVVNHKPAVTTIKKTSETNKTTTVKTSESNSEKTQEIRKPIKKTQLIRVPDVVGVMTNRAASVVRSGIRTVGSTIGIPMRNTLVGTVNTALLPIVAALTVGRKKRSLPAELQEAKGWKNNIQKTGVRTLGYLDFLTKLMSKPTLQSAAIINKLSNTSKRPLWSHLTRSTNSPPDSISNNATKAHSTVKRSTNSKIKNLKASTNLKHMIPWLYSAFSKNKNRQRVESRMADVDILERENSLDENEVSVESLSSPLEDSPLIEYGEENETQLEQNVEKSGEEEDEESTVRQESSSEFPDSFENQSEEIDDGQIEGDDELETVDSLKYTHGHGIIVPTKIENNSNNDDDDDTSKYTHGHGIIVPNPPPGDTTSLVSDTVNNQNILNGYLNSNFSTVGSNDGLYITTGIFTDELDMALDDLESLMSDIFIAPLPVEAVVAEDNDAVIIESLEDENKPDSVPVVSNLANIFFASSGSSGSSSSSSSSSSGSVTTSTTGVTIDPFASLYTFGLAAIGIFVLSLPIWVPFVAAKMKKKWNKAIYYRRQTIDRFKEFNPFSFLMRNLIPFDSEEEFGDPGPLSSEEVYGPAITNFADRRRRRRSINGRTSQQNR